MKTTELVKTAEKLEQDAKKLREAAEILSHTTPVVEKQEYSGTRAEQLTAFLASCGGGATRPQIVDKSGIPAGTIASLLGSGKKFDKDKRGFWHPKQRVVEKQPVEQVAVEV